MKKTAIAALCIASTLILCSCSGAKKTEESQFSFNGSARVPSVSFNSEHSSKPEPDSKPDSEQSSESSIQSSAEESEFPSELPEGLTKASRGKLRFTTSVLSLSVTFPDEFCVLNEDYIPPYGIYLQNKEGTATLLVESVGDKTLTYRNMTAYLREQYPEARVYATDRKDVVCKMNSIDRSGNKIFILQKLRVKTGGYNSAVICCRPEEREKYEAVLNDITFS